MYPRYKKLVDDIFPPIPQVIHYLQLYIPFFQSFRILTIISIYILECALFVKKNSLIFKTNGGHSYETRNRNNLEVVAHNTSKFEHSPYYSCVKIFERLPQYIKQSNEKKFKSNLIKFLNERCFYNLNDFLNYT
jgi:hypothetical protein